MSRETFERQPPTNDESEGYLEPVSERVSHETPPEVYQAAAQEQHAEVVSRLEPLLEAIREFKHLGMPVPGGLSASYERLRVQQKQLAKTLGLGKQLELSFPSEAEIEQRPSGRAA
jgi:hypothetical protein